MKKLVLLVWCMLVILFEAYSQITIQPTQVVTLKAALDAVKVYYPEVDADYFAVDSDKASNSWTIFVDPSPLKGWEHECYTYTIPKTVPGSLSVSNVTRTTRMIPPIGEFTALDCKDRYENIVLSKPIVKVNSIDNGSQTSISNNTYAVIISGGVHKNMNYERYWNDCSFIYQTLTKRYCIDKSHIFPLMADGDNPAEDTKVKFQEFKTQSLDLDDDGIDEVILEASKSNIQAILLNLASVIQKNDHLFIYVIDHGGFRKENGDIPSGAYIYLWNPTGDSNAKYYLQDYELAAMLEPIVAKRANVNVVLGQCHSGGFIDDLSKIGCVVATACAENESSWPMKGQPYDEFVYHWTCAVNGYDSQGVPLSVSADTDGDGHVSMKEAFDYALENDQMAKDSDFTLIPNGDTPTLTDLNKKPETPQYCSTPISIGEDLAFDRLPDMINLHIRDNEADTGKEPNISSGVVWDSPDIEIVKGTSQSSFTLPQYTANITIHNRGIHDYTSGRWLNLFWTKNTTSPTVNSWIGDENFDNKVTGGYLKSVQIPPLSGDADVTLPVILNLPNEYTFSNNPTHGVNLLAVISESQRCNLASLTMEDKNYIQPATCRGIAQKSLNTGSKAGMMWPGNILIRGVTNSPQLYTFSLQGRTENDANLLKYGVVLLRVSDKLLSLINSGAVTSPELQPTNDDHVFRVTSLPVSISKLYLTPADIENISVEIVLFASLKVSTIYTLDLIQTNQKGEVINGTAVSFEMPPPSSKTSSIQVNSIDNGEYELMMIADNEEMSPIWFDQERNIIGESDKIIVAPSASQSEYKAVSLTEEGELAIAEVSLQSEIGIKTVAPTANVDTYLTVTLKNPATFPAGRIEIMPVMSAGYSLTVPIPFGEESTKVDVSSLTSGWYVLRLMNGDLMIDEIKFSKR